MASGIFIETKDLVLFGLALYGAVLSSVTVAQALLRNRRRLKVTCAMAVYFDAVRFEPYLQIEAVNTGTRPVTVTSIGYKLPNGYFALTLPGNYDDVQMSANTPLPATLADGESAKMMISLTEVKEWLRERGLKGDVALLPQVGDSTGRTHEGKAFHLDPDES